MRLAILTLAAVLLGAPAAHAATVSVAGSTLVVVAAPGESNRLTIASGGAVTDAGAPLAAGTGCTVAGAGLSCAGISAVTADLGDGDDTLTLTTSLPLLATDGEGADRVTSASAADTFVASPGADIYSGGSGSDTVDYSARTTAVVLDLVAADGQE